jgi:hypothetical protein
MADIDWAILCDYAFLDVGRKTCVIGIFNRIFSKAVPAVHHQAALVVRFTGNPGEDVMFKVEIIRPLTSGQGAIGSFQGAAKLGDNGAGEVTTNIAGLPLPDYGDYAFNIHVGEKLVKVVTFSVVPLPEASGEGQAPPSPKN